MPFPQEQETQPVRDSGQRSNSNNHAPPPGQRQLQSQQQQPGYPSVMGCIGCPSSPYNYQYAYAQAPPPNYYEMPYPTHKNPGYFSLTPEGLLRGVLAGVTVLVILLYLSSIIKWLIFRPQLPIFTLTHFTVSGFNVTGPVFAAQCTANLMIENPNSKLKVYFDKIQSFIYYQKRNKDLQFLSTAFFPSMYINNGKTTEVVQRLTAGEKGQQMVSSQVVEVMRKERATGIVHFTLRIAVLSTFKTKEVLTGNNMMGVYCLGLKVEFEGDSGNGIVSLPKPLHCRAHV